MTQTMPVFILASAGFYVVSMIAMKLWGQGATPLVILVTVAALAAAAALEIEALRIERIGIVYIAILGAECVMIGIVSYWLFGETFTPRELAGGVLILAGVAVVWA